MNDGWIWESSPTTLSFICLSFSSLYFAKILLFFCMVKERLLFLFRHKKTPLSHEGGVFAFNTKLFLLTYLLSIFLLQSYELLCKKAFWHSSFVFVYVTFLDFLLAVSRGKTTNDTFFIRNVSKFIIYETWEKVLLSFFVYLCRWILFLKRETMDSTRQTFYSN